MHYEEIRVEGRKLKLWRPRGVRGYTVSDSGGWLDGIFDSKESSIEGFKLTLKSGGFALLSALSKRITHK